jgi:hypothetical protein
MLHEIRVKGLGLSAFSPAPLFSDIFIQSYDIKDMMLPVHSASDSKEVQDTLAWRPIRK